MLRDNYGCFACRGVSAGHIAANCPYKDNHDVSDKPIKEEVAIVDGFVVTRTATTAESDTGSEHYHSVPIITVPTKIQRAVIRSGIDSGASINMITPKMVKKHNLIEKPSSPIQVHQAMDHKGSIHKTKVVSEVGFPSLQPANLSGQVLTDISLSLLP